MHPSSKKFKNCRTGSTFTVHYSWIGRIHLILWCRHRCVAPCGRIKHFDLKHRVGLLEPESCRHSVPGRLKLRFQFSVNRQHVSDGRRYIGARSCRLFRLECGPCQSGFGFPTIARLDYRVSSNVWRVAQNIVPTKMEPMHSTSDWAIASNTNSIEEIT